MSPCYLKDWLSQTVAILGRAALLKLKGGLLLVSRTPCERAHLGMAFVTDQRHAVRRDHIDIESYAREISVMADDEYLQEAQRAGEASDAHTP